MDIMPMKSKTKYACACDPFANSEIVSLILKKRKLHSFLSSQFSYMLAEKENACPFWWAVLVTHLSCPLPCLIYEVLLSAASGKAD